MQNITKYNSLTVELKKEINIELCKKLKLNVKRFKLPKSIDYVIETATNGNEYKKLFVDYDFLTSFETDKYSQKAKKLVITDPLTNKEIEVSLNESFFMFFSDSQKEVSKFINYNYDSRYKGFLYVISCKGINNLKFSRYDNSLIGLDKSNPLESDDFINMLIDSFLDTSTAKSLSESNELINNLKLNFRAHNPKNNINIAKDNELIDKDTKLKVTSLIDDLLVEILDNINIDEVGKSESVNIEETQNDENQ